MEKLNFVHPSNMMKQKRIKSLIIRHGMGAYGLFWVVLELMCTYPEYKLPKNKKTFEKIAELSRLQYDTTCMLVKDMVQEFKVLNDDGQFLTSGLIVDVPENLKKAERNKRAEELFEELWKEYPIKQGKAQVSQTKKLELLGYGKEVMMKCIERYLDFMKDKDYNFKNGSTFFNSGYQDFLDKNYYVDGKQESQLKKNPKDKIAKKFQEIER